MNVAFIIVQAKRNEANFGKFRETPPSDAAIPITPAQPIRKTARFPKTPQDARNV